MRAQRSGYGLFITSFSVLPIAASLPEHSSSLCRQVTGKPAVGEPDQVTIEPVLIGATLVAGRQKDRVAPGVKSKGDAPNAPGGADAQFLHIGMGGPVQRISMRPTEVRRLLFQ